MPCKVEIPYATSRRVTKSIGPLDLAEDETCCLWEELMEINPRRLYDENLFGAVVVATFCTFFLLWEKNNFPLKQLVSKETYNTFFRFVIAMQIRSVVQLLNMNTLFKSMLSCEYRAFIETFISIFEVEAITHICIERYVVAKYKTNGWPINKKHYSLYLYLCLFFSALYSIPALYGIGKYGTDFTCDSCTLDMILPENWLKYVVIVTFLLRNVKPVFFMIIMLTWACELEFKLDSKRKQGSTFFTRMVKVVAIGNLASWIPMYAIRGWVLLSQIVYGKVLISPPDYIRWAMNMYAVSPILTTMSVILMDNRISKPDIYTEFEQEHNKEY